VGGWVGGGGEDGEKGVENEMGPRLRINSHAGPNRGPIHGPLQLGLQQYICYVSHDCRVLSLWNLSESQQAGTAARKARHGSKTISVKRSNIYNLLLKRLAKTDGRLTHSSETD
jgi:hypothetical protein